MPEFADQYDLLDLPTADEQRVRNLLNRWGPQAISNAPSVNLPPLTPQAPPSGTVTGSSADEPFLRTLFGHNLRKVQQHQAAVDHFSQQAINGLAQLDPGDPDYLTHQEAVLGKVPEPLVSHLFRDPRLLTVLKSQTKRHGELQHFFDTDPQSAMEYQALREQGLSSDDAHRRIRANVSARKGLLHFVERGGDPEDFSKFVSPEGIVDQVGVVQHLRDRQEDQLRDPPSALRRNAEELKKRWMLESENEPSDKDKEEFIKRNGLKRDDAGWKAAYLGVQQERMKPILEQMRNMADEWESYRYAPDPTLRKMAGLPPLKVIARGNRRFLDRSSVQAPQQPEAGKTAAGNAFTAKPSQ